MKRLLIGVIVVVTSMFVIYRIIIPLLPGTQENVLNESRCRSEKRVMGEQIVGVLTNKFLDTSSHMWETIEYSDLNKAKRSSLVFLNDESGAYDFIMPGDSIVKDLNSLELKVIRDGSTKIFKLEFGCIQK